MICFKCGFGMFTSTGDFQPIHLPCTRLVHVHCLDILQDICEGCGEAHESNSIIPITTISTSYVDEVVQTASELSNARDKHEKLWNQEDFAKRIAVDPLSALGPGDRNPLETCYNCSSASHAAHTCLEKVVLRCDEFFTTRTDRPTSVCSMGRSHSTVRAKHLIGQVESFLTNSQQHMTRDEVQASFSLWFLYAMFCVHCGSSFCRFLCKKHDNAFAEFLFKWDSLVEPHREEISEYIGADTESEDSFLLRH